MQILIDLLNFLTPYGIYSYLVMFAILIACGFGFPMPEDIVLITGGILAARGITDFWIVNAVCMLGVLGGDSAVFLIGRHFGPSITQKSFFRKIINEGRQRRVQTIVHKYGDKVIFLARFMPGLRTPIFLTCGTFQVSYWKFLTLDGMAALISVPLWIWVGQIFGENLELLESKIRQFQAGIYATLGLLLVVWIIYKVMRKRRQSEADKVAAVTSVSHADTQPVRSHEA